MKQAIALRASLMGPTLALLAAAPASAAASTSQLRVTLTIRAGFKLTAANDVDTRAGALSTDTAPYSIGVMTGAGSGTIITVRQTATPGPTINSMVYRDSAVQTCTVYARVPAQATLAADDHNDTVQVVITY